MGQVFGRKGPSYFCFTSVKSADLTGWDRYQPAITVLAMAAVMLTPPHVEHGAGGSVAFTGCCPPLDGHTARPSPGHDRADCLRMEQAAHHPWLHPTIAGRDQNELGRVPP